MAGPSVSSMNLGLGSGHAAARCWASCFLHIWNGLSPLTEAWRVVTVWGPCKLRALPSQMALREVPQ